MDDSGLCRSGAVEPLASDVISLVLSAWTRLRCEAEAVSTVLTAGQVVVSTELNGEAESCTVLLGGGAS